MAAAPTNAGGAATQTEFRKSASKVAQSVMKILSAASAVGQSAARAQQKTVARRSHGPEIIVAIQPSTNAAMAAFTIQPYQYMGGPSPLRGRCSQKYSLPAAG